MEKKKIINQVGDSKEVDIDYYLGHDRTNIDEIIIFLLEAKKKGANLIEFYKTNEWDSLQIQPVLLKLESDEDFKKRQKKVAEEKRQRLIEKEKKERIQLAVLKKKYEQ